LLTKAKAAAPAAVPALAALAGADGTANSSTANSQPHFLSPRSQLGVAVDAYSHSYDTLSRSGEKAVKVCVY
jgi:hypothetical protein